MPDINIQHFEELQRNQHSIDVEIDASQVVSPQQNFPMLLETPNSSNSVLNVIAINELGEQLPTEIEGVANDKNWIHLKDLVHSGWNRKIKVFYGGSGGIPATDSTYGSQNVWDSNFVFVMHMNNDPSGTIYDSTSNGHNGTTTGTMVAGDLIDASNGYGKAIVFESSKSQSIEITDHADFDVTAMTLVVRQKFAGGANYQYIFRTTSIALYQNTVEIRPQAQGTGGWTLGQFPNQLFSSSYETVSFQYSASTNSELLLNGVSDGSDAQKGNLVANSGNPVIMANQLSASYGDSELNEVRLSDIYRGDNWALSTHNNLNNPTANGNSPFYKSISKEHNFAESLQSLGRAG